MIIDKLSYIYFFLIRGMFQNPLLLLHIKYLADFETQNFITSRHLVGFFLGQDGVSVENSSKNVQNFWVDFTIWENSRNSSWWIFVGNYVWYIFFEEIVTNLESLWKQHETHLSGFLQNSVWYFFSKKLWQIWKRVFHHLAV